MSKLGAVLHSEIVQVYGSLNAILGALVVLNVVTLTPDQIAAVLIIANAVFAPIVRALVTPTAVRVARPKPPDEAGGARVLLLLLVLLVATVGFAGAHQAASSSVSSHRTLPASTTTLATPARTTPAGGPLPYRAAGNTDKLPSTLVARDEFNVDQLDPSLWSTGWLGSGITKPVQDQELACYDPAQVTIHDGHLHLKAIVKQETCGGKVRPYASGAINSAGKRAFAYGYFEARLKIAGDPSACSDWPAWWLDGIHWPADGEADIFECLSGNANATWHGPEGSPPGAGHSFGQGGPLTGWHIFAANWQPGIITAYYDGVKIGSYASATNITSAPQFLNLMEQVGPENKYGGPVHVPSQLVADYVRVWK